MSKRFRSKLLLTLALAAFTTGGCDRSGHVEGDAISGANYAFDDTKLPVAEGQIEIALSPAARNQVEGYNRLAFNIYRERAQGSGDMFFSPVSIAAVLGMAQVGAGGATAEEFKTALGNAGDSAGLKAQAELLRKSYFHVQGRTLNIRSALWIDEGIDVRADYLAAMKDAYRAGINRTDFRGNPDAARAAINRLGAKSTFGRINALLGPGDVSTDTRLVLMSTAFFRARWFSQFEASLTKKGPFYRPNGDNADVPMMHQTAYHSYLRGDGFQAVSLAYEQGETELLVFLPDRRDGLSKFESGLSGPKLAGWMKELESSAGTEVILSLPKFEIDYRAELAATSQALGLRSAFERPNADFSAMLINPKRDAVFADQLVHQAKLMVDEQGTEAVAATAMAMDAAAAAEVEPPKQFKADHPFFFVIRDRRSGLILFIGRYCGMAAGDGGQ